MADTDNRPPRSTYLLLQNMSLFMIIVTYIISYYFLIIFSTFFFSYYRQVNSPHRYARDIVLYFGNLIAFLYMYYRQTSIYITNAVHVPEISIDFSAIHVMESS